MTNIEHDQDWAAYDAPKRTDRTALLLLAVSVALGGIGAAALISQNDSGLAAAYALAAFAVVGVFSVLCFAAGLIHFGVKAVPHDLAMSVFSTSPDGLVVSDQEGAAVFSNSAYRAMIQHRGGNLLGMDRMLSSWAGSGEEAFRLMRAARHGDGWSQEFVIGLPAWPLQNLHVSVRPMRISTRGKGGNFLVWRIVDVTQDRIKLRAAKKQAEFAGVALGRLDIGLAAINRSGGIEYMNCDLAKLLDISQEGAQTLNFFDLLPQGPSSIAERFNFAEPFSAPKVKKLDLLRRDGVATPVLMHYKIAQFEGDEEPKLVAVFHSQHQEQSESDRTEFGSEFAEVFDAAPIAMGTVTAAGELVSANPSLVHLLGLTSSIGDSPTASILELVAEKSRAPLVKALGKAAANKPGSPPVSIALAADPQRTGRLYVCPAPRTGANKGDRGALIYGVDTSEQRSLEEQIAQSQKMQAVGQLAGGVAHDFNNILTAIIGFSDLLLVKHRPGDPAFQDIMNIKNNANRAAGLVRQLLAFSSKQTLRPSVLSLTDVIEDLSVLLDRLLGEKITSKVIHGRDLWQIKADENQLEQVIINLAVNARDAMDKDGELTIRTANISEREAMKLAASGLPQGEYVLCEVRDTGCGIPADKLEKIFEPFYTTKDVGKGTGLGLSTVYGIVQQTGGHIVVESQLGEGTAFKVYLPRHIPAETEKTAAPKSDKKEKPRDLTGSGTVLLVEDEEAVRAFASRALATRGYRVLQAVSGLDALETMKRHEGEIDLVISDVVMPEMDGPALLKRLRAQNPDIKFIFISGYAEDAFKGAITENEQFTFLPKPFSLKQLAAAVKEALSAPG